MRIVIAVLCLMVTQGCATRERDKSGDYPVEVKRMVVEIPNLKTAVALTKAQLAEGTVTISDVYERDDLVAFALAIYEDEKIDGGFDFMQQGYIERFLWKHFIPDSDSRGSFTVTEDWRTKWDSFSRSLVNKAKAQGLDGKSLGKSLSIVTATFGKSAHLPLVATYLEDPATGRTYWAIFAVWEYASPTGYGLGHVRVWLIDAKTFAIVAEARCS